MVGAMNQPAGDLEDLGKKETKSLPGTDTESRMKALADNFGGCEVQVEQMGGTFVRAFDQLGYVERIHKHYDPIKSETVYTFHCHVPDQDGVVFIAVSVSDEARYELAAEAGLADRKFINILIPALEAEYVRYCEDEVLGV